MDSDDIVLDLDYSKYQYIIMLRLLVKSFNNKVYKVFDIVDLKILISLITNLSSVGIKIGNTLTSFVFILSL